ncbi:MAG: TIGR04255 family protein [Burkholderiales bacterium]
MDDAQHLDKAPIVEALIDFRIKPREGLTFADLEPLRRRIQSRYTTFTQARVLKAEIGIKEGVFVPPNASHTLIGFRCESLDKRYVLQAHVDGFTVSRLRPYETWAVLREEAKWLWDAYVEVVKPSSVLRTAVRYINRLEITVPCDFDEYLTCAPRIPVKLPQLYAGFVSRVVVPYEEGGIQMVITQALEPFIPETMKSPIILDIDVFLEQVLDVAQGGYWETLETLRVLKNKAFFGSITDKAVELYK